VWDVTIPKTLIPTIIAVWMDSVTMLFLLIPLRWMGPIGLFGSATGAYRNIEKTESAKISSGK
jgi:hypothetical protein